MKRDVKRVIVVGGGAAGWLTAGTIAAAHGAGKGRNLAVTLIESPSVKILGVGEGTWPSMRETLQNIGISESAFVRRCDATFKQGSKFIGWQQGGTEAYYHPFTLPEGWSEINLASSWLHLREKISFADAVSPQGQVCERNLAPKEIVTPDYAYVLNYGYHLDAGKFADLLKEHCCAVLGVDYVSADVRDVESNEDGYIRGLATEQAGVIEGDLFVDCTGFASLLLGKHYQIPFIDKQDVLFNDSALALHVPYDEADAPIAPYTQSTAMPYGWVWDIGLQSRRGVGYVYSSRFRSDTDAEADLRAYLASAGSADQLEQLQPRKIMFRPGYREQFWVKNCVAIGVSAGFIEPLEASALVMIEMAAGMLAEQMPANFAMMEPLSRRYNKKFRYHWERVIDFLKLHYVLTSRDDSEYWRANKELESVPQSLQDSLCLWQYQTPWRYDTTQRDELFPSASFQYVLYGMGFRTEPMSGQPNDGLVTPKAQQFFEKNIRMTQRLLGRLPDNRTLLNKVKEQDFGLT